MTSMAEKKVGLMKQCFNNNNNTFSKYGPAVDCCE